MIRIIEFLMTGCWHRWRLIREAEMESVTTKGHIGYARFYECDKCKRLKRRDS